MSDAVTLQSSGSSELETAFLKSSNVNQMAESRCPLTTTGAGIAGGRGCDWKRPTDLPLTFRPMLNWMEPSWITVIAAIIAAFAVLSVLSGERNRQVQNASTVRQNSKVRAASEVPAAPSAGSSGPAKPPAR